MPVQFETGGPGGRLHLVKYSQCLALRAVIDTYRPLFLRQQGQHRPNDLLVISQRPLVRGTSRNRYQKHGGEQNARHAGGPRHGI
jgi:hypothetical protein